MTDARTSTYKRFWFCEHCGGDKPWNVREWIIEGGAAFCSWHCHYNFQAFLDRMARKGHKLKKL